MRNGFCVGQCAGQMPSKAEEEIRLHAEATCRATQPLSCEGNRLPQRPSCRIPCNLCSGSGDLKKYLDNFTYGWPSEDKFLYTANGTEASCG